MYVSEVLYLDHAEGQAKRRRQIFMSTWREKLDAFLQLNEREILLGAGKVSKAVANQLAEEQYDMFKQQRLKQEAQKEALTDDAELKKYLEGDNANIKQLYQYYRKLFMCLWMSLKTLTFDSIIELFSLLSPFFSSRV